MKRERQRTIIEAAKKAQEMHAPYIRDVLLAHVGVRITSTYAEGQANLDAIDIEARVIEEPKGLLPE